MSIRYLSTTNKTAAIPGGSVTERNPDGTRPGETYDSSKHIKQVLDGVLPLLNTGMQNLNQCAPHIRQLFELYPDLAKTTDRNGLNAAIKLIWGFVGTLKNWQSQFPK